jgi:DNA repair exonuclease SbcCD nuclease subunit
MTRVLHTGDTHLGYRQYHTPERRRDYLRAFEAVVDDAIEMDVDAVVHAGDLFHDRRPDLPDLQGTIAALRRLRDASIPFLAVVGNHEAKRDGQWLDLFADLDLAVRLDEQPYRLGQVALYGLDFVPAAAREELVYDFEPSDAEHTALVSHGMFEPFAHGDWDAETILAGSPVDFDALLLGDNHTPGTKTIEDTWLTYPGSTERTSASERDARGYNLVTFDGELKIARRTLDCTREFVFVDVELGEGEATERVRERVRQYEHEAAVTIVTVEGEGEPITPAAVEELAIEHGALVARVNDRRDIEREEPAPDVHFADPDEAVRERVRELGLSAAARDLDDVVRNEGIPDSNVRKTVSRRVTERLDQDGLDAFESADHCIANADPPSGDVDGDASSEAADGEAPAKEVEDDAPIRENGEAMAAETADGDRHAEESTADGDEPTAEADDQASMEEYL